MITSSSWNAGGPWIEEPDASMELLSTSEIVIGLSKQRITIGTPRSNRGEAEVYSLTTSMALPYSENKEIDYSTNSVINLDAYTTDDSYIEWDVPEGRWEVLSFFMCNTMQHLFVPSPNSNGLLIDHLSRRATRIHFDTIITRLATISTPNQRLKYLEVDSYEVWSATDWTPVFIEEFKLRYGYDPVAFLPLLKGFTSDDKDIASRFRGDFNRLVSDLIIENHFAQGAEISEEHEMLLFAEAGHGGSARVEPLKALGKVHVPMGEFWNRQRHWVTKEAASAGSFI